MNFEEFKACKFRNGYVSEPGLSIYIRKGWPSRHGMTNEDPVVYELANINADNPGTGALTSFLNLFDHDHNFYVENILNERLVGYLTCRQYQFSTVDREGTPIYPPCMQNFIPK